MFYAGLNKKVTYDMYGRKIFLIGETKDGYYEYLHSASWDCGWYWGFGYLETYSNKKNPSKAKDAVTWTHVDNVFWGESPVYIDALKERYVKTVFADEHEAYEFFELMRRFYIAKEYAEAMHLGGAHVTSLKVETSFVNQEEEKRINEVVIPEICQLVEDLLTPENDKKGGEDKMETITRENLLKDWSDKKYKSYCKQVARDFKSIQHIFNYRYEHQTMYDVERVEEVLGLAYTSSSDYAAEWICNENVTFRNLKLIGLAISDKEETVFCFVDENDKSVYYTLSQLVHISLN